MHVHAFSPLEVTHGAATLGVSIATFLRMLKEAGLGSLPGTAAEILVDEVRAVICPGKLTTAEWLGVVEEAHAAGLRTTATIMFGHFDRVDHWAAHLAAIRALQERTGGFTEFVPLPFVHMEAPLYHRGGTRKGPTWRETLLVIAVSRLALAGAVDNIQLSWVKMGEAGAAAALGSGANDFGGTLMNESISRAAGTQHGQEMPPEKMDSAIRAVGRTPWQRTTLYGDVPAERRVAGRAAAPLADIRLPAAGKRARVGSRAKAAAMAGWE
jgi:FO synthase